MLTLYGITGAPKSCRETRLQSAILDHMHRTGATIRVEYVSGCPVLFILQPPLRPAQASRDAGGWYGRDVEYLHSRTVDSMLRKGLIEPAAAGLFPQTPQVYRMTPHPSFAP